MRLSHLSLLNFRNYEKEVLSFSSGTNIFVGNNAQGKTNALEAIYLLATLQTFRPAENKDLIQWERKEAAIEGIFQEEETQQKYSLRIEPMGKKPRINDKVIKKTSEYFGLVHVICFCPLDLQILQGAPTLRRRYLDRSLFNFDPSYAVTIGNYYRALLQHNAALRIENEEMIEIWREKQLSLGAKILLKRLQFVVKLNTLTSYLYREISGSNEEVFVQYDSELKQNNIKDLSEGELLEVLKNRQKEVLGLERRLKRSIVGPHKDQFSVFVSGKNLRVFGSQGEQRTAILALKLSELVAMEKEKEIKPLFLLDDIASELDEKRKEYLFQALKQKKTQVFVTTTDAKSLKTGDQEKTLFKVENGKIQIQ